MQPSANAILAINSTDRFIGMLGIPVSSSYFATWVAGNNFMTWVTTLPGIPLVGGILYGNPIGTLRITSIVGVQIFVVTSSGTPYTFLSNQSTPFIISQTYTSTSANQPYSVSLFAQYYANSRIAFSPTFLDQGSLAPSNNFTIQSPGPLIYGYIDKIIVSQVQMSYNIPTICIGLNDTFYIADGLRTRLPEQRIIPFGFYTPDELASLLQILIRTTATGSLADITCVFDPRQGFIFTSNSSPQIRFYFPDPIELGDRTGLRISSSEIQNVLKTYRVMGLTTNNSAGNIPYGSFTQVSDDYPNFLYTPYIDIFSDVLTNYQDVKDTNTLVSKKKGLVARIYLSGTGNIQPTNSLSTLGSAPFLMTADLNTPKVIRWDPSVAIPSIDIQLLDQYGDLIPGHESGFSTEFQMTLLCLEGRD